MNILFVSTIYSNPVEPGKGVFNRHLVRALAVQHEVKVIAPIPWTVDPPWGASPELTASRTRVLDGVTIEHPRYYFPPRVLRSRAGWFYWKSVKRTVNRVLQHFRPDIVLSYWAYPDGAVGNRIARMTGARSAVIVGGSDILIDSRQASQRDRIIETLRSTEAVLAVSDDLRQRVNELGAGPDRSILWRQGVETDLFHPGSQSDSRGLLGLSNGIPVLVWVGRMAPVKGLDVLIQACKRLVDQNQDFRLYLVGDGPLRTKLEADCKRFKLTKHVCFVGPREQEEIADWYRAADLVVLPSRSEGLPNVLRESISCGIPFVASCVGGIAEIAEERLDRLVPPEDPGALADAIAASLAVTQRPSRVFRPLSWSESAEQLIEHVMGVPDQSIVNCVVKSTAKSAVLHRLCPTTVAGSHRLKPGLNKRESNLP